MSQRPTTRDAVLALLAHHPDGLTKDEIAAELGKHKRAVDSSIYYDRQKFGSTNIRIKTYAPMRGKGGRARAVYVLGPSPDAERPDLSGVKHRRERSARYREKHRARINARLRVLRGSTTTVNPFAQLIRRS
jgi:hypothetical protein